MIVDASMVKLFNQLSQRSNLTALLLFFGLGALGGFFLGLNSALGVWLRGGGEVATVSEKKGAQAANVVQQHPPTSLAGTTSKQCNPVDQQST